MLEKPQPLDLEKLVEDIKNMVDYWNEDETLMRNEGVIAIKRKVIEHIKSACEFYLRYKDNPRLFLAKEADSKYVFNYIGKIENILNHKNPSYIAWRLASFDYNEWLFKLAFKDVLEGKE